MALPVIPPELRSTTAPNGSFVYGRIEEDIALLLSIPAGEIRLLNGFENSSNRGFGLRHIEAKENRKKQISSLGFRSIEQMVYQACSNFESIHAGDVGRKLIVKSHLTAKQSKIYIEVVIEWQEDRGFWSVITALPTATVRKPQIWPPTENPNDN